MKTCLVFVSLLIAQLSFGAQIFRTGNSDNLVTKNRFYACLAGGGYDEGWGIGWKKLLESTDHGDVVIVRADDERGGYEDWIFNDTSSLNFPHVNSVSTIVLESRADGDDFQVLNLINNAELVFFAGGDQSLYIDLLKNSKVANLIQKKLNKFELSIAGTSAGMAILGEFDYGAHYSSPVDEDSNVDSEDVLKDPMGKFVDIQTGFIILPFLQKTITDTHFSQRDREGRLLGFVAKTMFLENDFINGIAADEETAICYNQLGQGHVFGNGLIQIIMPSTFPTIDIDQSLNFTSTKVIQLKNNQNFDFNLWNSEEAQLEYWKVEKINSVPTVLKSK